MAKFWNTSGDPDDEAAAHNDALAAVLERAGIFHPEFGIDGLRLGEAGDAITEGK